MLITLKILLNKESKKQLFLNAYQIKSLGLNPGTILTLIVGFVSLQIELVLENINTSPNNFHLSNEAFLELIHYHGQPLNLVFLSHNTIVLGPTLGLTVTKKKLKNINQSSAIKKRALLALEKGLLFSCFCLKDVDWEKNLVEAYYLNPVDHKWVMDITPVPQVIYDRGSTPGPKTVTGPSHQGNVQNIQWINSTRTFSKWATFKALSSFEKTTSHLPQTTLLTLSTLEKFITEYKYCFIKGNYGRSGRQVYRVEKSGKDYLCKTGGSVVTTWPFKSIDKLFVFLKKIIGKKAVLQQGISLALIDNCPFDMRILVQKDARNNWNVTALNFRIAQPEAIVTNFAAGSKDVLKLPGQDLLHLGLSWKDLTDFSLKISSAMEDYFGPLGEIGLDVALDNKGKLWLIEANSRPSSIAYRKAPLKASSQIFGLPLDYGIYLVRRFYSTSNL